MFLLLCLSLGLAGCDWKTSYPKNIQEFPEPWQKLDPGKPPEKPLKIEVVKEGGGVAIGAGDLVQVGLRAFRSNGTLRHDFGPWWVWIGFRDRVETAFFTPDLPLVGALVGVREGTQLKYLEAPPGTSAPGDLFPNPVGDPRYYSWKKNTTDHVSVSLPRDIDYDVVEIKRVCKAEAKYRTVHLYDDSPLRICPDGACRVTREPREIWVDEGRIEGTCQDGRKVYFQYGPIGSMNGRRGRTQAKGYWDEWFDAAWKKIPRGVQFYGNQVPVPVPDRFLISKGEPSRIDVVANDRDADQDRLSARILSEPKAGTLAANPDGSFTYTPTLGCNWWDGFKYKVSDNLVESYESAEVELEIGVQGWERCEPGETIWDPPKPPPKKSK